MAAFRRLRIHRHAKGRLAGEGGLTEGCQLSPREIIAKRTAFHSLLHQRRYPSILLMSRFMLSACMLISSRSKTRQCEIADYQAADIQHRPLSGSDVIRI